MFFRPFSFAFRRESFPLSALPFRGAQSYEVFSLVKTRPILHPALDGGGQRYKIFDIHKYRLTPSPALYLSKIMPNSTTGSAPPSSTPLFHPLPFRGAQSYEVFRFVKLPTSLPCEEPQSYGLFGTYKSLLSKTPLCPQGERKGTKFSALSSPSSLSSPHSLTGRQRCEIFDIHKCRPIPSRAYPSIKDHANSPNQTLSHHHPPRLPPLLFFGERKVTNFLPLSSPPSHPLPQDTTKLRTFGHSQVSPLTTYPLSKTPYVSQGRERKGTKFSALSSPLIR